jgi:hypothetical protein
MKFRIFFIAFLFIALTNPVKAQYYFYNSNYYDAKIIYEAGASVGGINALTDIGGSKGVGGRGLKDFLFKTTNLSGGIFFGMLYKNKIGIRMEAMYGVVSGWDSILVNVAATTNERYERNLSFRTPVTEIALVFELHPLEFFSKYNQEKSPTAVSPYLVAGIGFFHFNPQGNLNGKFIDLKPLHTEGQGFAEYPDRKEYKLNQINIPLGFGVRYDISAKINLRAELLHRVLFTDYLDDVSTRYIDPAVFSKYLSGTQLSNAIQMQDRSRTGAQTAHPDGIRGNPANKDAYLTYSIKLGYTFGRERVRK